MMRSLVSAVSIAALLAAQMPATPVFAQSAATPVNLQGQMQADAFAKMFAAFPDGGEQLSNRIADMIVANPKIAPELASYAQAQDLNRAQKIAVEQGFAQALKRLGINAADFPVSPGYVDEGFNWWWVALAAALIAGVVVCGIECFHHHHHQVSPN
jgi:hypothetical protein